jgi:hypothetical protein
LLIFVAVGIALAQNDAYSPAAFESFVKKELKKDFKKRTKDDDYVYDITGSFHVRYLIEPKMLLFYEQYVYELPRPGQKAMAARLKKWNDRGGLSKAEELGMRTYGGASTLHTVRFSATVDVARGISGTTLKEFHDKLDREFEDFVIFMQDLLKHDRKGQSGAAQPGKEPPAAAPHGDGQDRIIKEFTPEDFERVLKNDLKVEFAKRVRGNGAVLDYAVKDGLGAQIYVKDRFLLFFDVRRLDAFDKKLTLEMVNAWNLDAVYSRLYLLPGGAELKFEGTLDVSAGIAPTQIKAFYARLDAERGRFFKALGGLKKP